MPTMSNEDVGETILLVLDDDAVSVSLMYFKVDAVGVSLEYFEVDAFDNIINNYINFYYIISMFISCNLIS